MWPLLCPFWAWNATMWHLMSILIWHSYKICNNPSLSLCYNITYLTTPSSIWFMLTQYVTHFSMTLSSGMWPLFSIFSSEDSFSMIFSSAMWPMLAWHFIGYVTPFCIFSSEMWPPFAWYFHQLWFLFLHDIIIKVMLIMQRIVMSECALLWKGLNTRPTKYGTAY